jgi:FkbM family methyltransferase
MSLEFYSQHGQDRFCYEKFFQNKKDGFFLEIGALDGIRLSNTYFYEKMGWSGICVEPSPKKFSLLEKNRNCICEKAAVSNISGQKLSFMDIHGYGEGLSGIVEKYNKKHRDRIQREIKNPNNLGFELVEVETISFNDLLEKHDIVNVDLCSIDIEGGELDVLKSIDFSRFKIGILIVENNYNDQEMRNFMSSSGYELKARISCDDIYVLGV